MERARYEIVLERLDRVLHLAQDLGLQDASSPRSRFPQYRACLEHLIEVSRRHASGNAAPTDTIEEPDGPLYLTSIVEGTELGDAAEYLAACQPDAIEPKLRAILRGPAVPLSEDFNSNEARNIMFELTLAAQLWRVGVPPHWGDRPDLWCEIEGKRVLVECKRPSGPQTVKDQVTRARRQLNQQLRDSPPGTRGVIAISLTKVLNRGDKILSYANEPDGRRHLADTVSALVEGSMRRWRTLEGTKILGLLFHVIMPALDRAAGRYVVAQQMELHTWGQSGSLDQRVAHALGTALRAVER